MKLNPRVKECNDIVERFLMGEASEEELTAARSAAESARSETEERQVEGLIRIMEGV